MCELIDWQFLMPDGDTWGPWASEVKSLKEEDPPVPAIKVPVRGLERGMTLKEVEAVKGTKGQLQETRPNGLRVYRFYVPGSPINLIVSSSTERLDGIGE